MIASILTRSGLVRLLSRRLFIGAEERGLSRILSNAFMPLLPYEDIFSVRKMYGQPLSVKML